MAEVLPSIDRRSKVGAQDEPTRPDLNMNFPVDDAKATEAMARLLEASGGAADYLRLIKLIYLADRDSLIRRGIPIVGGHYFSMRKGPVVGEVMDFACQRNARDWKTHIDAIRGHKVKLLSAPDYSHLSQFEIEILDAVVEEHFNRSTDDLVEWCHQYCPEYERVRWNSRKPISVESVLRGGGKTADRIHKIVTESAERAELDALLA
jgi:hypothetical protein